MQRAVDEGVVGPALAARVDAVDDVGPAGDAAQRPAAADDLAIGREIGGDAEVFLRPAERQAETGHHLVEDQDRAGLVGDLTQAAQELRLGEDDALAALDDDSREIVLVLAHDLTHRLQVVIGRHQDERLEHIGHTAAISRCDGIVGGLRRKEAEG